MLQKNNEVNFGHMTMLLHNPVIDLLSPFYASLISLHIRHP